MSSKDSLGDRMKGNYENAFRVYLPKRMPVILRLDGKAFHTLTRKFSKPYDAIFMSMMDRTALYLCDQIQGAELAYVQSDEISILLHNYKRFTSEAWFDNNLQKMVSVGAALASSHFSRSTSVILPLVQFDCRAFVLPETEVANYFIWRQQDWERNSVQMLAQSLFSHRELQGKNCKDLLDMCFERGHNWGDRSNSERFGRCIVRGENGGWVVDSSIPIFKLDRSYVEKHLKVDDV